MNKENENKLVPKLRFPEFIQEKSWETQPLGKISKLVRGPFGGALKKEIFVKNGFAVYEQFHAIYEDFSSFRYHVDKEKFSELKRFAVAGGDLIMSCSGTMGKFAKIPQNFKQGVINQALLKLTIKENKNIDFIKISLELPINQEKLLSQSAGGAIKNVVSVDQIRELDLSIPTPKEQQKIADCLSSLDDLIGAETEKLAALKGHKKGLMQQLFPAEGEKLPKLRFPEFRDGGEWEEKKLGEVAKFINGKAYKQEELLDKGKYRVLRVGNFFTNKNWYYSDLELEGDKYCEDGDLLYAWSASFGPRVWRGEKVIYHYHIWKVLKNKAIDGDFLYILLDYETEKMKSQSNGFALLHITKSTIENWKCDIPVSINEQKKIAEFISYIDEQILEQTQKVDSLNCHKKGLMQGLFPKID